ncbi:L-proline dehydrogenase [Homoserinimonas aerilata]|uniref:L-proline dehydrogenase n=1 Tax=Homoserinimonas aerilata TaxID=1162970 RepID=A0A542XX27_9MICO|nr:bifunctional proline dehydrogenase/L-glutamate gamma-semialdehyde dehydrogenase [Homoserinimonas aerilata]TQL40387.1 L-proline dehydrogenase [Homoserinimonas aerilata]
MQQSASQPPVRAAELADVTIDTVRRWLAESADTVADPSAERLSGLLKDPHGLDFTIGFVDRVIRPSDLRVAGRNFERLSRRVPRFLPLWMRIFIQLGGGFAVLLPWFVVPIARAVFRRMVGHLVLDADPRHLDKRLQQLRSTGVRLGINLLGEAVLGEAEADRRLAGAFELLGRHDVDYVSVKVSAIAGKANLWAYDETVRRVVDRLTPLYEFAANSPSTKFVNLDMEEFRDLDLTIDVFTTLLEKPGLERLEAGIVVQAYLPDALGAQQRLTEWATARRAAGGAGIRVRLVKGANLAMERVDAELHDWPLATLPSKLDTDANYKRMLDWALTPERTDAVRIGVAGHNLFDVAFAWQLAQARSVIGRIEFEMLLGMAPAQADVVRRHVGGVLLYTPVVRSAEFGSAIAYLVRRLEENASDDNFMSAVFSLADDSTLFDREAGRFRASLARLDEPVAATNRTQDRSNPVDEVLGKSSEDFSNSADTDPSIAANRAWGRQLLYRAGSSGLGGALVTASAVHDEAALERVIESRMRAGAAWAERPATERAGLLREAAPVLAAYRGRFIETLVSEVGSTLAEADIEASGAVDLAHYYALLAPGLEQVENAEFEPGTLTVVAPSAITPIADTAGAALAALAAGSAVIVLPAHQARRSAAIVVEALHEAGAHPELLSLVVPEKPELARALVAHPSAQNMVFSGDADSVRLMRSWRPDRPPLAQPGGVNSIIVTPSADPDLAVADLVASAYGHAGQGRDSVKLAILVGSVAESQSFRRQLVDAASTRRPGPANEATTGIGPLIDPARGGALSALTTLDGEETWLLRPTQTDDEARHWSPGIRDGVTPDAAFARSAPPVPVLGLVAVETLEEAIEVQAAGRGTVAGIHSLDAEEIAYWVDRVDSGTVVVNRATTGLQVGRQPIGGWRGAGHAAGGPDHLLSYGQWRPVFAEPRQNVLLSGVDDQARRIIEAAQPAMGFAEFDLVRAGAESDEIAWQQHYAATDPAGLTAQRNVQRYLPAPTTIRLAEGASQAQLVRVIAAAARAGAPISISSAEPIASGLVTAFGHPAAPVRVDSVVIETDARWHARLQAGDVRTPHIRLIGGDAGATATVLAAAPEVALFAGPVTTSGRLELLPFLRAQSVSITAHRYGNPDPEMALLEF